MILLDGVFYVLWQTVFRICNVMINFEEDKEEYENNHHHHHLYKWDVISSTLQFLNHMWQWSDDTGSGLTMSGELEWASPRDKLLSWLHHNGNHRSPTQLARQEQAHQYVSTTISAGSHHTHHPRTATVSVDQNIRQSICCYNQIKPVMHVPITLCRPVQDQI